MKVLWISNVLFPDVCRELNITAPVVGGWMHSGAKSLLKMNPNLQLAVVAKYSGKELKIIEKYEILYYLIPQNENKWENDYIKITNDFNPEIVHIHGTEFSHSLAYVNTCGAKKVVVSIQGLVSVYAKYYLGGIKRLKASFRDFIRRDSIYKQKKQMSYRGKLEIKLLSKVKHLIGRTSWDKSHSWTINANATYHFCNETLRESFYYNKWSYSKCEPYSIFLSQAHYPIKGLQQIIKALPIILENYPETKVYVAGNNFIDIPYYRQNGFARYINKEIKKLHLKNHLIFLGMINEEQMVERFCKANVFVCPSSIENSPNSVGEAQLIGTPCVASYVGGTMDMIKDGHSGFLYRFEETTLLAQRICQLFADQKLCEQMSSNERKIAQERHDGVRNAMQLLNIYKTVIADESL